MDNSSKLKSAVVMFVLAAMVLALPSLMDSVAADIKNPRTSQVQSESTTQSESGAKEVGVIATGAPASADLSPEFAKLMDSNLNILSIMCYILGLAFGMMGAIKLKMAHEEVHPYQPKKVKKKEPGTSAKASSIQKRQAKETARKAMKTVRVKAYKDSSSVVNAPSAPQMSQEEYQKLQQSVSNVRSKETGSSSEASVKVSL